MAKMPSGSRWRERVASVKSIARIALQQSGGHVAATRVLHDALFIDVPPPLARSPTDCAVLVVALAREGERVGVIALADRSGRVFSDEEVATAERLMRGVASGIQAVDRRQTAQDGIGRLLHALGGETAAVYAVAAGGDELALVAAA